MSVCPSVRLKFKIEITAKPIGLYSSGNIPTGHVVFLSCFLEGWETLHTTSPLKKRNHTASQKSKNKFAEPIGSTFLSGFKLVSLGLLP